jgi:hypothetical protein
MMDNEAEFATAWENYEPRLRQMLFEQGAEPEAIDAAAEALRPIFLHHCRPLTINPKSKEETVALVGEWMRQQILGLLSELALREVQIWRARGHTGRAVEPPGGGVKH